MNSFENQNKRKGVIGTILFHAILIFSFFFIGLSYQDPPPEEEGISINFGHSHDGDGEIEPDVDLESTEIVEEEIIKEKIESKEIVTTQKILNAPKINIKKEQEAKEKKEIVEEKKPKINKKALYPGKKNTNDIAKPEGNNNGFNNQGILDGDSKTELYTGGGIGNDGTAYQLGGRKANIKPKPLGNQVEGKVVVTITVDRSGQVINAIAGVKGSTTLDIQLLKRAKIAALKTRFEAKETAPNNQQGKIIYYFKLN